MKNIKNSKWAKEFKKDCPTAYNEAIKLAQDPNLEVDVYKSDEAGAFMGDFQWVIATEKNFWMDAKKTKKEALALCKEMGWKLIK
jgi:hypothetical protein